MSTKSESPPSEQERFRNKERVLAHKRPSQVSSIADAMVIKDQDIFFLCERDGQIPIGKHHGFGLFYHDCRFLNGYELRLDGKEPQSLVATARRGFMGSLQLINPGLEGKNRHIEKESIGIKWERLLDGENLSLFDEIEFENFTLDPVEFSLELAFQAHFEDIFIIRGMEVEPLGHLHPPSWKRNVLQFRYDGGDGLHRSLQIKISPTPSHSDNVASFKVRIPPRGANQVNITLHVDESPNQAKVGFGHVPTRELDGLKSTQLNASDQWVDSQVQIRSNRAFVERILDRSFRDLHVLRSRLEGLEFYAGGVPWFVTLFGRDSIISALQTLAFEPRIAAQTLRLLARFQGEKIDDWRDEQPGKILHELRVGELARIGEIPQSPYYGTIDATPLFLLLLARHANWVGDLKLFGELRENVERALEWIDHFGDSDGDGFLEYQSRSEQGMINHGWKDSGDAIVNADGSLAQSPIALVEVQGYVYRAKLEIADLFQRAGEIDRAERLRLEAQNLRERFNREFWLERLGTFALALQKDHEPAAVVSSNPGQALWTGIVDLDKAQKTVDRLMASDMFNGWGVSTLSSGEKSFNPVGYHRGAVWPHDNSIIAAGCRRYGFDQAAIHIFDGITDAATHFDAYRLPEVFAGFRRDEFGVPVRYPVACHPQAWAAGTIPFLLQTLLGLEPDGFEQKLRIVRPLLPLETEYIELRRLRVGSARADLRFQLSERRHAEVQILSTDGPLEVIVEPHP